VEADRLMEERVAISTTVTLYRSMTGVEDGNKRWRQKG
jgi:hypothetical protein